MNAQETFAFIGKSSLGLAGIALVGATFGYSSTVGVWSAGRQLGTIDRVANAVAPAPSRGDAEEPEEPKTFAVVAPSTSKTVGKTNGGEPVVYATWDSSLLLDGAGSAKRPDDEKKEEKDWK